MATSVTFFTSSGAVDTAGDNVDAEAIVTTGSGTVTVQLFNLLTAAQMKDAGQLLSDFSFVLANSALGTISSENTITGATLIDIDSSGNPSADATAALKWAFSGTGGSYTLDSLADGPAQTIIGGNGVDVYSNANSSIAPNHPPGPHNPFVLGTETFVLNLTGVTGGTQITSGTFSFGTAGGDNVPGAPTPEPRTTGFLMAAGLAMFLVFRRKKVSA